MYSIVKTYECRGIETPVPVMTRIHRGSTQVLKNYWDAWNSDSDGVIRIDNVEETGLKSMDDALKAFSRYY